MLKCFTCQTLFSDLKQIIFHHAENRCTTKSKIPRIGKRLKLSYQKPKTDTSRLRKHNSRPRSLERPFNLRQVKRTNHVRRNDKAPTKQTRHNILCWDPSWKNCIIKGYISHKTKNRKPGWLLERYKKFQIKKIF